MARDDDKFRNFCGYFGKCLCLFLGCVGIGLSAFASLDCEFLYFENESDTPYEGLEYPLDRGLKAYVGIFSYHVIESDVVNRVTDGCVEYDGIFGDSNYEELIAAQFCALFGPIIAGFALFMTCFELCICSFYCSFLVASLLFLTAAGVQAGTFAIFAEPAFCFEDDSGQSCDVGNAVYFSGASVACFWIACLLLCCFPRPDPFCKELGGVDSQKASNDDASRIKRQPSRRQDQEEEEEEADYEEDYGEDVEIKPPTRKASKITKKDFDTPEMGDNVTNVEIKEKTFPDGTRQVDEITYYDDGTSSVKTQTYAS